MTLADLLCIAVVSFGIPNADFACHNMHTVVYSAEENKIDPAVFLALIYVESRWSPDAVSQAGACGLTQIMPRWSAGRKNSFGERLTCKELHVPETSIKRGAKIFAYWYHKYSKRKYNTALCGYNAGFRCKGGHASPRGIAYSKKVLKYAKKIKKEMKSIRKSQEEDIPGCRIHE